jgi:hypothetical protein
LATRGVLLPVFCLCIFFARHSADAQQARGELRVEVHDQQGAAVAADGELASQVNHFRRAFRITAEGHYLAQSLPFGVYRLSVNAQGFAPWVDSVEIRSEVPVRASITLGIAPVRTELEVTDAATLLDPYRTGAQYAIGRQSVAENPGLQPGRTLSDLVHDLPGWLYEANGVLHPRGSEYDVQYVVNGLPITQNRSLAFAPPLDAGEVESMRVFTADYAAEYGRKLGGIIEVTTEKDVPSGLHGRLDVSGASFSTTSDSGALSYTHGKNLFCLSGGAFHTGRFLDPPVLENFTNTGNGGGASGCYARNFSERDRLRISLTRNVVRFQVPDYLVQQINGQRQDVSNAETRGQVWFQHLVSPDLLFSVSGSVLDATAKLFSNPLSTPVVVFQDRGYREGYGRADLAGHRGRHDWKVGVDAIFNPVHEQLQYSITDPAQFDPGTRQQFQFVGRRWDLETSAYAQDQIRLGRWNVSAGLRFDQYAFVVHQTAWSPRIGISRYLPSLNLLIHGSYDRAFQTPAIENLLLASSPQVDSLNPVVVRLPVRPSQGNFYELGVTKAFLGRLRVDANFFRRDFRNYSDDDVLLDTGVSFPIAFTGARIIGEEARVEVPHWGRFSGYVTYANQSGLGQSPITGGLFLGSDATSRLLDTTKFAVTQDQRNTAAARIRFQASRRLWLATGAEYGSGLPADSVDTDAATLLSQYGSAILNRVNLARGRVRPSLVLDTGAGVELFHKEERSASVQLRVANLTNRVNVINFASLFSVTAVAPPRSVAARLILSF